MIALVLSLLLTAAPGYTSGYATHYAPGVMGATVAVRQEYGQLPAPLPSQYAGFVARPSCDEIGHIVWLRPSGKGAFYPFLVADCAGLDAWVDGENWMEAGGFLVELDWNTAVAWGSVGRGIKIDCLGCENE